MKGKGIYSQHANGFRFSKTATNFGITRHLQRVGVMLATTSTGNHSSNQLDGVSSGNTLKVTQKSSHICNGGNRITGWGLQRVPSGFFLHQVYSRKNTKTLIDNLFSDLSPQPLQTIKAGQLSSKLVNHLFIIRSVDEPG
ncbi:uncharacterized protein LOC129739366 isoform X2 [Uranotaenia lowii]|uniref:uncharacterized protein LOC129739366 isoform X2 n=1 Tax=Uranotaenia lowii TaxID=190385 RepID=UPI002478EFBF|nr:uncharacterized protein LOC129739366 isoform X2 [Uranotaenia lowii]